MAIGQGGRCWGARLAGFPGRGLPSRGQKFALNLKQARFDRTGTTKSPEQACQPMSELELDHCSRINTADEDTLERSVGSNIFESLDDGLVSKPVTPGAVAGSAALRIDIRNVLHIVTILEHPTASDPASLAGPIGGLLLASLP